MNVSLSKILKPRKLMTSTTFFVVKFFLTINHIYHINSKDLLKGLKKGDIVKLLLVYYN